MPPDAPVTSTPLPARPVSTGREATGLRSWGSMEQRVSLITLGVDDLGRARRFYEALGWSSGAEPEADVVFFKAGALIVALWSRAELAADSGVVDGGGGWGGVTPAYN